MFQHYTRYLFVPKCHCKYHCKVHSFSNSFIDFYPYPCFSISIWESFLLTSSIDPSFSFSFDITVCSYCNFLFSLCPFCLSSHVAHQRHFFIGILSFSVILLLCCWIAVNEVHENDRRLQTWMSHDSNTNSNWTK